MTRILYIDLSPSPGGSTMSLFQLLSHLDRTRVQPLVVLSTLNTFDRFDSVNVPVLRVRTPQWEPRQGSMVDRLRASRMGDEMRKQPERAGWWHFLGDLRRYGRDVWPVVPPLRRIIRDFKPDLIHLNDGIQMSRHGALAARLSRRPAICHYRAFDPPLPVDRWLVTPGIDGWIFISQAVAEVQLAAMGHPRRWQVIPNAIDLQEFDKPVDSAAVRSSLGVPADVPLIGMIGRVAPWKGQLVFVEALAQVSLEHPTVHGVIVGLAEELDGPGYADHVRQRAGELGLGERLRMVGHRGDVPQVLAALDCVVHCSVRPEPFGRVIIEGMAASKPVIASSAGGAAEIVSDGVDGLLTPPGDAAALAHALARLLADPAECTRIGQAGRRTVEQRYQIGAHVAAIQSFYEQVLSNKG